jgi:hypothetical protein
MRTPKERRQLKTETTKTMQMKMTPRVRRRMAQGEHTAKAVFASEIRLPNQFRARGNMRRARRVSIRPGKTILNIGMEER